MTGAYGQPLVAFAQLEVLLLWAGVALLVIVICIVIWVAQKCEGK